MLLLYYALVLSFALPTVSDSPVSRTEDMISACKEIDQDDTQSASTSPAHASNRFESYFDFTHMTNAAIAPHVKKFSPEQIKRYRELFTELIRLVAFPSSGKIFNTCQMEIGKSQIHGKVAQVPVTIAKPVEDINMDVVFHWHKNSEWHVTDVDFDGASLVKDYQNQFGRIILKEGVDKLLEKLAKRLEEERKK